MAKERRKMSLSYYADSGKLYVNDVLVPLGSIIRVSVEPDSEGYEAEYLIRFDPKDQYVDGSLHYELIFSYQRVDVSVLAFPEDDEKIFYKITSTLDFDSLYDYSDYDLDPDELDNIVPYWVSVGPILIKRIFSDVRVEL